MIGPAECGRGRVCQIRAPAASRPDFEATPPQELTPCVPNPDATLTLRRPSLFEPVAHLVATEGCLLPETLDTPMVEVGLGNPHVSPCRSVAVRERNSFPYHPRRRWTRRSDAQIEAIVGHHSGGPGTAASDARFHVRSAYLSSGGAPGLAYHLHVDWHGVVVVTTNWDEVTWSVDSGKNAATLSICMQGNTKHGSITAAQRAAVRDVIGRLGAGNFKPFHAEPSWPRVEPVTTHRHIHPTSCPGDPGERFYREIAGTRWTTQL